MSEIVQCAQNEDSST